MNFGPWGTFADESYAPQAERARNVVVGPDSSRLLNFLFAAQNHDRWVESAAVSASVLRRGRRTSKRRPRARASFGELVEHVSPV